MSAPFHATKATIRRGAAYLAKRLDAISGGRITPDAVTYASLVMHLPIAVLIAQEHYVWAAGLLVVFGLFDVLDGELARYQKRASPRGMLLDASTDRFKEVMLYGGIAYVLAAGSQPRQAVWAVIAAGAALSVSYVKAKGEAVVASAKDRKIPHAVLNRMFADGLMTFEVRMAIVVISLLASQVLWGVVAIAILASFTAVQRLVRIGRQL